MLVKENFSHSKEEYMIGGIYMAVVREIRDSQFQAPSCLHTFEKKGWLIYCNNVLGV